MTCWELNGFWMIFRLKGFQMVQRKCHMCCSSFLTIFTRFIFKSQHSLQEQVSKISKRCFESLVGYELICVQQCWSDTECKTCVNLDSCIQRVCNSLLQRMRNISQWLNWVLKFQEAGCKCSYRDWSTVTACKQCWKMATSTARI